MAPDQRHLPELRARSGRRSSRSGTASGCFYECRPDLVTWARGCGQSGWVSPFGGAREAALEPRVGGAVVAVRGDHRAERQGPRDGRRLARPVRRDRPRGVRARAAAQRPVRVPQHRRQEDVDLEGPRRRRAHDRRGRPARAAPLPVPAPRPNHAIDFDPEGTDQIPRLFDEFDKFAAATAGREVKGELPPGYEATFRYSLLDPDGRRRRRGGRVPAARSRHLAMLIQIPGVDVVGRVEAEKGSALTDRERAILDERRAVAARAWLETYAPESARLTDPARRGPARRPPSSTRTSARSSAALAERAEREEPASGDAWQAADLRGRDRRRGCRAGERSRRSTARSSAGRTVRARAGCWPASIRPSSDRPARAAEAGGSRRGGWPA